MSGKGPILVIDDDRDDHEMIKDVVADLSIKNNVRYFSSGRELLDYLRVTTDQPFLILCDINMPEMNGIEVRKCINEDDVLRTKSIPFVFFTTSANTHSVKQAYEMSVQGFFEKPSNYEDLKRLFKKVYEYWDVCRHPEN